MDLTTAIIAAFAPQVSASGKEARWLSTENDSTSSYSLNVNCWAYGLATSNFRSRAVWNSWLGEHDGPTLLMDSSGNAQFCVSAAHYAKPTSGTVRWIKADGTVVTGTIASGQIAADDIWLMKLTTPISASDVPGAKLFPSNFLNYAGLPLPAVTFEENSTESFIKACTVDAIVVNNYIYCDDPSDSNRAIWNESIVGGASGSPVFTVVDDVEVLLTSWHFGGGGSGPSLTYYLTELESAATTLAGTAITFAKVDLSSYALLAPTAHISTSAAGINSGDSATLTWSSTHGTSGSIDNGIGAVATSGSQIVSPTVDTTYTLTITGDGGETTDDVTIKILPTVEPEPTATFTGPSSIISGQTATLTWTTADSASVSIDNDIGPEALSGSVVVTPSEDTTYTMTVVGAGGSITKTHTVTVSTGGIDVINLCDFNTDGSLDTGANYSLGHVPLPTEDIQIDASNGTYDHNPPGTWSDVKSLTLVAGNPNNDTITGINVLDGGSLTVGWGWFWNGTNAGTLASVSFGGTGYSAGLFSVNLGTVTSSSVVFDGNNQGVTDDGGALAANSGAVVSSNVTFKNLAYNSNFSGVGTVTGNAAFEATSPMNTYVDTYLSVNAGVSGAMTFYDPSGVQYSNKTGQGIGGSEILQSI